MKYDDIIHLSRPKSIFPKMTSLNRAAQFSAFSPLKGYEEMTEEKARIKANHKIFSEEELKELNDNLLYAYQNNVLVEINYIDNTYLKSVDSIIKKIDEYNRLIILENKQKIYFKDIIAIKTK